MNQALSPDGTPIPRSQRPSQLTAELLPQELPGKIQLLRGVSLESVWGLLEHCPLRWMEAGETLLEKRQSNAQMFLVLQGKLTAFLDDSFEQDLAVIEPGQTVGELSVIDGSSVSASVKAAETSLLLEIDEDTYWRLVRASHEFCTNMMLLLSARMRSNNYTLEERCRLQTKYEREALADGLTGLYNRRWLNTKLHPLILRAHRDRQPFSLFMIDVDHFKKYNDSNGHAAGDQALRAVAQVIQSNVRPLDLSVRYGGEEFCVVLPYTAMKGAQLVAERVRQKVEEMTINADGGAELPPVTASIGVASLLESESGDQLLARADTALYEAKENGRNRVACSSASLLGE
jgi:diguanylate cyclase (GGDEF)-like protein